MPSKCKSGGRKHHQNGKVTAKSATTQISEKKVMVAESATIFKSGGTSTTISVIVVVH